MNTNVLEIGEAYLNALGTRDINKITSLVDPNVWLKMPMTEVFNRNDFIMAIRRMQANLRELHILHRFSSGNTAMFMYEATFNDPVGLVRAVSLMTIEGDKIKEMEVIYDARPFERIYAKTELQKAA
jgi:SnoaL-like domain